MVFDTLFREWRQAGGHLNPSHPINDVQSPTMPSSRTRPRTLQPPPHVPPMQQALSGPSMASRGRKPRQVSRFQSDSLSPRLKLASWLSCLSMAPTGLAVS